MADFLKGLLGGNKPASPMPAGDDADFADFAGAPSPEPASISSFTTSGSPPLPSSTGGALPYTAWYKVWERTTINDFRQEMYILPFILVVVAVHLWGTRVNRRKATNWMKAHAPVLRQEFAQVGYINVAGPSVDEVGAVGLSQASANKSGEIQPENLLREKAANEYMTYATGRQNVAFVDFKLSMVKRYNPLLWIGEAGLGLFFESFPVPEERMEATSYVFDGRESQLIPGAKSGGKSTFDGFVFAIVHKDLMKRLRDDRYDLSLTTTKDHAKLPAWTTVMSESAEVTETLLTPELIKAVEKAGEALEALVVSDQPMDQPKKLDDTVPKKRVSLSLRLQSTYDNTLPLFHYFLRMPDHLVSAGKFRPEAMRRIRQTRDEQIQRIKRVDEDERAEERKLQGDRAKKEKRDQLLKGMSADEQRKYLEKEREKDMRRSQKRKTMKA